jgi:excinuclease ABC subunit C
VNKQLKLKLEQLPTSPGVYFHKSIDGEIIYVGKAAVLKNRVRQYFQSSRAFDNKTMALVHEIDDTDWVETESEIDALFLESEMVKRYMPRYNVLLRDDKSQLFVRVDMKSEWPHVSTTRNPDDDGAEYFGPFYNGFAIKKALRYLRRVFPYYTREPSKGIGSRLDEDLGLSPRQSDGSEAYKANLRKLIGYIKGNRVAIVRDLEAEMKQLAKDQNFEQAARVRNRINYLGELQRRIMFGDQEFLDISKDHALNDLAELLGLQKMPKRIEGYDISHMSGTNVVASMVVFTNGVSDRTEYRKFKTKTEQNNDFDNMNETILRRLSEKNTKSWGLPDLVLIDGGKGQLGAALAARDEREFALPFIGLAKKEEQIVVHYKNSGVTVNKEKLKQLDGYITSSQDFMLINLPHSTHIVKLLQRIRNESHRFAVSYHTVLKRAGQTRSQLTGIPGIGPVTQKKLLREFGSLKAVKSANTQDIIRVIGTDKAQILKKNGF